MPRSIRGARHLLISLALGASIACRANRPLAADLILTNARVYTLRWNDPAPDGEPAAGAPYSVNAGWHPDAEAVVIAAGRILYVGTADSALTYRRDSTRVVDLHGNTVIPGLIDAHAHVLAYGVRLTTADRGVSHEAATDPLKTPPTVDQTATMLERALAAIAASGYTMVHEVDVDTHEMLALEKLARNNALPIRVYAILSGRDTALLDEWFNRRGADSAGHGNLTVRAVELAADSSLDSHGANMLADYADRPGFRGVPDHAFGYDTLAIAEMMEHGFQLVVDATGDDANRRTLDFIQSVMATNAEAAHSRVRIEHADVLSATDVSRFIAVGAIASMQPARGVDDMATATARLGPGRMPEFDAWRSLRRATARVAFGSDLPTTDDNIFYILYSAITRHARGSGISDASLNDQVLTPEEALRGFTSWAAYASYDERQSGRITIGMRADLTVLTVDPLAVTPVSAVRLLGGQVSMTVVDGHVVFERR